MDGEEVEDGGGMGLDHFFSSKFFGYNDHILLLATDCSALPASAASLLTQAENTAFGSDLSFQHSVGSHKRTMVSPIFFILECDIFVPKRHAHRLMEKQMMSSVRINS